MDANHSASHPLRKWRLARDLTLEQAGAPIGVTGQTFGKYELGKRVPRPAKLAAIIAMTGGAVTASDFLPAIAPVSAEPLRAAE
ncbi:helix-turn-helix transcriptional regulator [Ancylobacter oerskovii]|nr:helix-turn-helix transcriptional regulator [Ancylobacter oerskovii]